MKILRSIIRMYLYTQYFFNRATSSGSFGKGGANYLKDMEKPANLLKSNLIKHHVKQFNEASCSVASVVSAVNAAMDLQNIPYKEPLTQQKILEDVKAHKWQKRMSSEGDNGKRGLPLYMLGDIVKDSFETYKIQFKSIETVQADRDTENAKGIKALLLERLKSFENDGNCLILAHFNQGVYVKTIQLPHISPVGGYDEATGNVTMLDVDPEQTLFYEISFDRFYEGISNNYNNVFRSFGYKGGGYIIIQL